MVLCAASLLVGLYCNAVLRCSLIVSLRAWVRNWRVAMRAAMCCARPLCTICGPVCDARPVCVSTNKCDSRYVHTLARNGLALRAS